MAVLLILDANGHTLPTMHVTFTHLISLSCSIFFALWKFF
jgi:hypothetical protein